MTAPATISVNGRLGRDPERKTSASGTAYTRASIAYNVGFGDNEKTVWCSLTIFGKAGERFAQHATKGSLVYVAGEPSVEAWTNKNSGEINAQLAIVVDRWTFVGPKTAHPDHGTPSATKAEVDPGENVQF